MIVGKNAVKMPEESHGIDHCGGRGTGWLSGNHPWKPGQTKPAIFCFEWNGNTCNIQRTGKVTNCDGYYVYFLKEVPCHYRHCATADHEVSSVEISMPFIPL